MENDHSSVIYGTRFPNRLFLGCLPPHATAEDIGKFFSDFGKVVEAKVVLDDQRHSKRFGFVSFATREEADAVLDYGPIYLCGKKINVGPAIKKETSNCLPQLPVQIITKNPTNYKSKKSMKYTYQVETQPQSHMQTPTPKEITTSSSADSGIASPEIINADELDPLSIEVGTDAAMLNMTQAIYFAECDHSFSTDCNHSTPERYTSQNRNAGYPFQKPVSTTVMYIPWGTDYAMTQAAYPAQYGSQQLLATSSQYVGQPFCYPYGQSIMYVTPSYAC